MSILLKNATYIDWKTLEFKTSHILVDEGLNGKIHFLDKIDQEKGTEIIDCKGKYVTKSFAVGHHHAYSALSRGMGAPKKNPENFYEVLKYIWWTLDKCLDSEMVEYSALVTAMACAKAGSTFVIDHHASPFAVKDSLDIIAKAFEKVGISHLLCYEISDRDGEEIAQQGLDLTKSYLKNHQGLIGLHASFTVGNETLKKATDLMSQFNSGIHIHVAEDSFDQKQCIEKYKIRVVERLNEFGVLNSSKSIFVHCLHLNDNERELIKNASCWVAQNTESNLNNNVGYFKSIGLGDRIMLGTDGMHSDMLQSAKSSFFVGQGFDKIDYPASYKRFRNANNYLAFNKFKGDGDNNLVILDYNTPTEINQSNFLGHFIFGINSNHITDVISNGKLIVKNRQIQTVNEEEILVTSRKLANKLWKKMQNS
ncbi:MAG: amidohydrolase family protein [Bacteroidales bacterium]